MSAFQKGNQLPVVVEEASADIVVVSIKTEGRTFRGVLLDSTFRFTILSTRKVLDNVSLRVAGFKPKMRQACRSVESVSS